ncbi:MAG TPA: alpha/beta fold hydrolase [Acidimicrobiales bacterium]|nr:alpha/beta fold hydrolase [Acidimicrobiales bacterium]
MAEFESFDGVVLHYETEGSLAPGDVPVVLLHGFAASYEGNFVAPGITATLVAAGRQVIGLDARGHGLSSKPHEPAAYENDAMARDVIALFDHLGLSSADVVGYSMGAGNAMRFAQLDTRVRRLVLGGLGDDIGGPDTPEKVAAWNRRSQRVADAMDAPMDDTTTDMARRFVRFAESTGADKQALAALQRSVRTRSMGADAADVKVPTLVVCGDKDFEPHTLASRLPDGRAEVVSGDHLSAVGDPALAKAIVSFLAEG